MSLILLKFNLLMFDYPPLHMTQCIRTSLTKTPNESQL